jgi:hypothetical protein
MELPATGWKVKIWGRDYKDVIKNIRAMIKGTQVKCKAMSVWIKDNKSSLHNVDGKEVIVGKYEYNANKNIIKITELPICVYNNSYIKNTIFSKGVLKPEFTFYIDNSNYDDISNSYEINIELELAKDGYEKIKNKYKDIPNVDAVEEFLGLRMVLNSNINMIDHNKSVKEFKKYEMVVNEWFCIRKSLYAQRINRLIILTRLNICLLENIINFTQNRDNYDITNSTSEIKFIEILEKNKYDKFNSGLLSNPSYTDTIELEDRIILRPDDKATEPWHNDITYNYILNLNFRNFLNESFKERKTKLENEKRKLQELLLDFPEVETNKCFKGQIAWLKELDELEKIIDNAIENGWK